MLLTMKKRDCLALSFIVGAGFGATIIGFLFNKQRKIERTGQSKLFEFYLLQNQWLSIHQEGKTLVDYFKRHNYHTVAIYGMKELGERLYDELNGSEVEVKYAIDKNADSIYADVDIVTPSDTLAEVDAIVVTAIHYFDEIHAMLIDRVNCPVLSLDDVICEMM